ncbi:hypothetical protein ACJROX_06630 [Pseudalkalibacillus sp. A8]|uniref:hypothetical protein n=1 Tax=Pseudalkalibacillus sp. A8 TaxID=3382641 RepID=UPI0038B5C8EB
MAGFLAFVGFIAVIAFIVMAIVSKLKKTGKAKKMLLFAAGSFVIFVIAVSSSASPETETASTEVEAEETSRQEDKKDEKSAEELAKEKEAEEKAKAEEEAKRKEEEAAKKAEEEERKKKEAEEAKRKAEALKNSGSGDTATDMFELEAGFVVFDATYNGTSNFIVELLDENGNNVELLINHIGAYKGKTMARIPAAGEYMLNVKANGAWLVNGSQEVPEESESGSISGTGDDVRFVHIDSGMKRFHFDHKGDSNFNVMANGTVLLANEIGTYSGSTAQKVQDDAVYIISIKSEGKWQIDIE